MFVIVRRVVLISVMLLGLMACDDDREDLIILTDSLPNGRVGETYLVTLEVQGDADDFFLLGDGALPPNIGLSSAGVLSGTFVLAGTFEFTIEAVDLSDGIVIDRFARRFVIVVEDAQN